MLSDKVGQTKENRKIKIKVGTTVMETSFS